MSYFYVKSIDLSKHQPRNYPLPLFMWIICGTADIMPYSIFTAIEYIIGTTCDVDGINEVYSRRASAKSQRVSLWRVELKIKFVIISSL